MHRDPRSDGKMRATDAEPAVIEARRIGAGARPAADEFTFVVELGRPEPDCTTAAERRHAPRRRTRLRSGKIVDRDGRFLTECLMHDLSAQGGRLRLPPGAVVPLSLQIYDDQTGLLHQAVVLWRRDRDIGVALRPAATDPKSRAIAADLRRKFYAVRS